MEVTTTTDPPLKTKTKTKTKHQLSHEERKELKKQKKLQRKLRLAEKKRQRKRDHLDREIKYGQITLKRHEKNWREMLIKIAQPRMRQELEFAWHNFERVIDCKDFTISLLLDELRDSEEQYMQNLRTHLENIDKLLGIFGDRLDEIKDEYEAGIKELQDRCNFEVGDMNNMSNESVEYLKTMLYQLEMARKEHSRTKRAEYFSRLDEVDVRSQLALQKLKAQLEIKYQDIFDNMKQFIKDYNKKMRKRRKEHKLLKEQDDAIQELIGQQFRQIKRNYDLINKLRHKLNNLKQTEGNKLLDLQDERQYFSFCFLSLKAKLDNDQRDDFQKLARLGGGASDTFDYLEKLNKKGQTILKLAAVCRKFETQKEKILPFPVLKLHEIENKIEYDGDTDELRKELELFWQRVGQAYSVYYILKREKQFLTEENELITDAHNEYCDMMMYPPIKKIQNTVGINKIDGNLEVAKYNTYRHGAKTERRFKFTLSHKKT